jgi:hypothetical protein
MSGFDGLDEDFRSRLERMIAASGGRIRLGSGYRSVERQQQLWDAAVQKYGSEEAARKWVAPPGRSNHNHGIAGDLQGDLELAHQLAPMYGLAFPMKHEPWHIEPTNAHETADPDAYTAAPDGTTVTVDRHDLTTQLSSFIDIIERGPNNLKAPKMVEAPTIGEVGGEMEVRVDG